MSESSSSSSGGIGFTGLLTTIFIVLKLVGKITWSWFWVLAPVWIGLLLWCFICLGVFAFVMIADVIDKRRRAREDRKVHRSNAN